MNDEQGQPSGLDLRDMRNEGIFRGILGTLGGLTWLVRLYFMRRGNQSGATEISRSRNEGLKYVVMISSGLLGTIAGLAYIIAPERMRWAALPLPRWSRWVGAGLYAASLPLFFWSHHALGENWSTSLVIKEQQTLISGGPYRWVRHPMYTTIILSSLGSFFLSANWVLGIAGLGTSILCVARVGEEEALMVEEFGDQYRTYMRRTGRFLPPLGLERILARPLTERSELNGTPL